jgi:Tol biopolymer transport system component
MIEHTDLDRTMTSYFEARTTSRAPDGLLDAALTRVETTRQRPGWLIADRWLAGSPRAAARLRTTLVVTVILALLVGSALAVGLVVGSQHRLPPPFGLAKPGLIAIDMNGHIYVQNPDGTGGAQLTSGPDIDTSPTFSPDGTLIAYQSQVADNSSSVIVMSSDGSHRVVVADQLGAVGHIAWSPDSRRIAFGARIHGGSGHQIYVGAVDRSGATPVTGPDMVGDEPAWSPDGTKIAFKHLDPAVDVGIFNSGTLWIMAADGSHPQPLGNVAAEYQALRNLAWSPDGTRLAFVAPSDGTLDGPLDVFVINADGTGKLNLTSTPESEFWPSWSPDGKRIAFARSADDSVWALVVADADGPNQVTLAGPTIDGNSAPVWSPDGTRLLAYEHDDQKNRNVSIAVFDPLRVAPTVKLPADNFGSSSWQRLAP